MKFKASELISKILKLSFVVLIFTQPLAVLAFNTEVVPVNWNKFKKGLPIDADSSRVRQILLNSNKYALTSWWNDKGFSKQKNSFLEFGGINENQIRPAADEAFALAVSLKTGAYDQNLTGISREDAQTKVTKLISSLAFRHISNSKKGWGNSWQSALWASNTGFAGWLLWDNLSSYDKALVKNMVIYESNRFNVYDPPYYRSLNGKINYHGDTKAEENAWNGTILQIATAMMPNHPNKKIWQTKMLQLAMSSFSSPIDPKNNEVINGRPVSKWVNGSNINADGSLVNHGKINPDYMATFTLNINTALAYTLASLPIPKAVFHNADVVYKAFVQNKYAGKTIYTLGSDKIYYPKGKSWGSERRMQFVLADIQARIFGLDKTISKRGGYWSNLHEQAVLNLQKRTKDGRTYIALSEDTYSGREEWVAYHAGQAYLTQWLNKQGKFQITNQAFPFVIVKK